MTENKNTDEFAETDVSSTEDKRSPQRKKGGGAKLSRSETVTVRLDPKLRYLADLAARKQRRTLSSFIEWSIEESLDVLSLNREDSTHGEKISHVANRLWSVNEAERFLRLAILYPELLSHEEQLIWQALQDSYVLSPACNRNSEGQLVWNWKMLEDYIFPKVRELWPDLMMSFVDGRRSLERWVERIHEKISRNDLYPSHIMEHR